MPAIAAVAGGRRRPVDPRTRPEQRIAVDLGDPAERTADTAGGRPERCASLQGEGPGTVIDLDERAGGIAEAPGRDVEEAAGSEVEGLESALAAEAANVASAAGEQPGANPAVQPALEPPLASSATSPGSASDCPAASCPPSSGPLRPVVPGAAVPFAC